jgi:hypothetical protein
MSNLAVSFFKNPKIDQKVVNDVYLALDNIAFMSPKKE